MGPMPNGGSDRHLTGGKRGSTNNRIPMRDPHLAIPNPFYTYCANHPHHRTRRHTLGPVYVGDVDGGALAAVTRHRRYPSALVGQGPRKGYPFFSSLGHALEDLAQQDKFVRTYSI